MSKENVKTTRGGTADRLLKAFESMLGVELPLHVRCWDGSEAGPAGGATIVMVRRRALRHFLWSPNELGLVRAYVSGDLDIEGDVFDLLSVPGLVASLGEGGLLRGHGGAGIDVRALRSAVSTLVRAGAVGPRPAPPAIEAPPSRGRKHSRRRDASSVSHHYDVGNDFYRLFLGSSMVYSCGYWAREADEADLDGAQYDKLDLVCRKLGLRPGMRLLDVGCGWGSLAVHAAKRYGVTVVGVSLSQEQVQWARERCAREGLADSIEIRVQDYRDVDDGPFDAISSIGMSEHVGNTALPAYARKLAGLLAPQGRLLNHAIASVGPQQDRDKAGNASMSPFIERYIFPDGEILPLSRTVDALEGAGLDVRDTESLREHYALTLRAWVAGLRENWTAAVELVGEARARTWLLYLAGSALGFEERNRLTIHQVLAVKQTESGKSGMPPTRSAWLARYNPTHSEVPLSKP